MSGPGVTCDADGAHFALFSAHATRVDLCLFDRASDRRERVRVPMQPDGGLWRVHQPGVRPGQLYGYRVDGPWDPDQGLRFNPSKVLLDPYARAIGRSCVWHPSLFAFSESDGRGVANLTDSAAHAALALVVDPAFDWGPDRRPQIAWQDTVIYELHVKGMTALHPLVPERLRGTYLGLASQPVIDHLRRLGVTAVELLPVHAHVDEQALVSRGLVNYWGYNTLAFFAPDPRFASDPLQAVIEFKTMVRALHAAGLEVILDVVYNHTAETDHTGPNLSFRGIDNPTYYRLEPENRSRYEDFTGCGNTMNMDSPETLRLMLDSLRYWVEDMHVDGFRFDLAAALARGHDGDRLKPVFDAIRTDAARAGIKLIAEPWDAAGGYQLGGFPPRWSEWNGKYRDAVRRFWRGDPGGVPELATRIAGSSDLFAATGRGPEASVNFVTAHDGFTLADLVGYAEKHNEANGEGNRDGESNNFSWNGGVEGPSDDAGLMALRLRQRRNLLLTLAMSQGVPMLSGGDEVGRSQRGNNNAYCQDSPLSWTSWDLSAEAREFLAFVEQLLALRATHPTLRRKSFLEGRRSDRADVMWLRPDGAEMADADWADPDRRTLMVVLDGSDPVLMALNAAPAAVEFSLPPAPHGSSWTPALFTGDTPAPVTGTVDTKVTLQACSAGIWI